MFSKNQLKAAGSGLMLVLVVVGLLAGATGGAVGQTATATPTDGGALANSTVAVDNDTRSVYADLTAGSSNVTLNVTFVGIGPDGNETKHPTRTISLTGGEERLVERTDVNTSAFDSYRVKVTAPNVDSTNATATVGTIQKVAGGTGAVGSAVEKAGGIGVVVVVAGAALLILRGRDD